MTRGGEYSFERCSFEIGLVSSVSLDSLCEFIKLAREKERDGACAAAVTLSASGENANANIRSEYTLVAGCIVPRARLIKRQDVSHVTNVV